MKRDPQEIAETRNSARLAIGLARQRSPLPSLPDLQIVLLLEQLGRANRALELQVAGYAIGDYEEGMFFASVTIAVVGFLTLQATGGWSLIVAVASGLHATATGYYLAQELRDEVIDNRLLNDIRLALEAIEVEAIRRGL